MYFHLVGSMQLMMEEELQRESTRRQYEQRQGIVQEAINSSLENDKAIEAILASKGKSQEGLISKLLEDEKYQREAFQSLLVQQDQRSQVRRRHVMMHCYFCHTTYLLKDFCPHIIL